MHRTLASLVLITAIGVTSVATADDPVERAAEKAADAKRDNKPKRDRPQEEPTQANRPDGRQPKVVPADTTPVRVHKKHHHRGPSTDKQLHDPTDLGNR